MNSKWIAGLAFLGVFLFGAIAGGAVVARWGRMALERRAVDSATVQQWRRLADDLQLTPEQRERLRPVIAHGIRERLENQREIQRIGAKVDREVLEILTPEQAERFKEFRKHGRDKDRRWQHWLREQRKRADDPPVPPGPEPTR